MMKRKRKFWADHLGLFASLVCAGFMLCLLPVLYRNAFFDINRFKVEMVYRIVPICLVLVLLSRWIMGFRPACNKDVRQCFIWMGCFCASCVISCTMAGFKPAVLWGNEGRYCGLAFMLCCGVAFGMIATGQWNLRVVKPMALIAGVVAMLGIANALGADPLQFYARMKAVQEPLFLSTIGNVDFYGSYLVMVFPLVAVQSIWAKHPYASFVWGLYAGLVAFGAVIARTDSACVGLHLACLALLIGAGTCYRKLARVFALWTSCFASMVGVGFLTQKTKRWVLSGILRVADQAHIGQWGCVVCLVLAVTCLILEKKQAQAPGKRRIQKMVLGGLSIAVVAYIGAVIYYSTVATTVPLKTAASFLRFNDEWGSHRGFVYTRAFRAFSDYDALHGLFGVGMEQTVHVLKPYFDHSEALKFGIFNDAHCQPLQILLTCGLCGMVCFVAVYIQMITTLLHHAEEHPIVHGVFASIFAYGLVMLINVTQPILIGTYLSVGALGLCAVREIQQEEKP